MFFSENFHVHVTVSKKISIDFHVHPKPSFASSYLPFVYSCFLPLFVHIVLTALCLFTQFLPPFNLFTVLFFPFVCLQFLAPFVCLQFLPPLYLFTQFFPTFVCLHSSYLPFFEL